MKEVKIVKTYKAYQILNKAFYSDEKSFASLHSNKSNFMTDDSGQFMCVRVTPDTYLLNEDKINNYFSKGFVSPLVVTNYKMLALILVVSQMDGVDFIDFSFKENSEESVGEKDYVQSMLTEKDPIIDISNFLKENSQKIQYIDLKESNNKIRISSTGAIYVSPSLDINKNLVFMKIVIFLFTGELRK